MVSSLDINLSGEQVRAVIRAVDADGSGYIDFSEFEAALQRHEEVRPDRSYTCLGHHATMRRKNPRSIHRDFVFHSIIIGPYR